MINATILLFIAALTAIVAGSVYRRRPTSPEETITPSAFSQFLFAVGGLLFGVGLYFNSGAGIAIVLTAGTGFAGWKLWGYASARVDRDPSGGAVSGCLLIVGGFLVLIASMCGAGMVIGSLASLFD